MSVCLVGEKKTVTIKDGGVLNSHERKTFYLKCIFFNNMKQGKQHNSI